VGVSSNNTFACTNLKRSIFVNKKELFQLTANNFVNAQTAFSQSQADAVLSQRDFHDHSVNIGAAS